MRRAIWGLTVLALLWSAWWFAVSQTLSSGVTAWFDARRAEGWQAELGGTPLSGYPARVGTSLRNIALADPATGLAVQMNRLDLSAPTYWPADPRVDLPGTPITFATPHGRGALVMADGALSLDTYPGAALELASMGWRAGPWQITLKGGAVVQANALDMTLQHKAGSTYDITLTAPGFGPGAAARAALRVPASWPQQFDALDLRATVGFDVPWNRAAIETRRPQPRRIDLHQAEAVWGDLSLRLAATLDIGADGVPSGTVNLRAEDWPVMLDLAEASGAIGPRLRAQVQQGLSQLARLSGDPDALDVQINFAGGIMAVGFIPIGPAPRLILR